MHRYILTRLFYAFISLVLLSVTIFVMIRITGDPVVLMADPGAKEEDLQAIRIELGLDKTYIEQYIMFISKLVRGDFGKSFMYRVPVFELYLQRLPASIELAGAAMAISVILGIPLGIFAAVRVNTWLDSFGNIFANLGLAMPSFWVGHHADAGFCGEFAMAASAGLRNHQAYYHARVGSGIGLYRGEHAPGAFGHVRGAGE